MKAAIDIGTNTVLLLVGEVQNNELTIAHEEYRIPRLGKEVDHAKILHVESIERVLNVLLEYKSILEEQFPDLEKVTVTATSAVRDAANRNAFIALTKEKTGFDIVLLSGDEEARLTYFGALATLNEARNESYFVLDIGGGSTELALGREGDLLNFHSFDMGCVRFTERFLKHNPPYQEEIFECKEEINQLFAKKKFKVPKKVKALGVAGTLTSLAAIDLQIDEPDVEQLNGHVIDRAKLTKSIDIFRLHTHDQLLELSPILMKGREDIFLAGLLILECFLNYYKLDEIIVSTGGIRHGVLLDD